MWDWGWRERRWCKDDPDQEIRQPKTAWDIAQLLVVPLALVGIGLGFNFLQAHREMLTKMSVLSRLKCLRISG
jgi:hypothetical protein